MASFVTEENLDKKQLLLGSKYRPVEVEIKELNNDASI
jgi:hypothetical protein